MMRIHKILNNNAVTILDASGEEVIIMGPGVGFQKKKKDEIDESKIEKRFRMEDKHTFAKLEELLEKIPSVYMELSEEIIKEARLKFAKQLQESIYISLTDHIHFAVERHNKGLPIKNGLIWEVKRFYPDEYAIGMNALSMINERLSVQLPEDEAASIALHFVNAQIGEEIPTIVSITKIIQEVLKVVSYHYQIEFDEQSLSYYRFVTHLKFFAQRLLNGDHMESHEDSLYPIVQEKFPKAASCADKIKIFLLKHHSYTLTEDETLYLTLHIQRIVREHK